MSAKQPKLNPAERRCAPREVLTQKPTGKLQLYLGELCLDVVQIRDISPFGVSLQLNVVIDDDAPVRLKYVQQGIRIEVSGTVVWRRIVKWPDPNPLHVRSCWVGIFLHPSDIDANFALYQAITGRA